MAKLPRRRIYLLFSWCAWLVVATGVFVAWMKTPFFVQVNSPSWLLLPVALLGALLALFGIPAGLILWGAMGYYCSRNSRVSKGQELRGSCSSLQSAGSGRRSISSPYTEGKPPQPSSRLPRSESPDPVQKTRRRVLPTRSPLGAEQPQVRRGAKKRIREG
jgi:hypothetical protein